MSTQNWRKKLHTNSCLNKCLIILILYFLSVFISFVAIVAGSTFLRLITIPFFLKQVCCAVAHSAEDWIEILVIAVEGSGARKCVCMQLSPRGCLFSGEGYVGLGDICMWLICSDLQYPFMWLACLCDLVMSPPFFSFSFLCAQWLQRRGWPQSRVAGASLHPSCRQCARGTSCGSSNSSRECR